MGTGGLGEKGGIEGRGGTSGWNVGYVGAGLGGVGAMLLTSAGPTSGLGGIHLSRGTVKVGEFRVGDRCHWADLVGDVEPPRVVANETGEKMWGGRWRPPMPRPRYQAQTGSRRRELRAGGG